MCLHCSPGACFADGRRVFAAPSALPPCVYCCRRVDLLKVDVERAELLVLQGIAPHHWPIIQQVTMEVGSGCVRVFTSLCELA